MGFHDRDGVYLERRKHYKYSIYLRFWRASQRNLDVEKKKKKQFLHRLVLIILEINANPYLYSTNKDLCYVCGKLYLYLLHIFLLVYLLVRE